MKLDQSIEKHNEALQDVASLRDSLHAMGGPQIKDIFSIVTMAYSAARSELVRDVTISLAQAVLEEEALTLMMEEKPDSPIQAIYLRKLSKRIQDRLSQVDVKENLPELIKTL